MKKFFWFLLLLIASVMIGLKVAQDPGYAVFMYRNWSISMPLWIAVLGFIAFLYVVYLVMAVLRSLDRSVLRWGSWISSRRKNKASNKTHRGLIELIEGHWGKAEQLLLAGLDKKQESVMNYLAAAKAAHEQHALDRRDAYLRKAHEMAPQADIAIGLTQARLQHDSGQYEQELATLERLQALAPRHRMVLKQLERLYVHLGDWDALLKILPQLRKEKILPANQYDEFEKNIYQQMLRTNMSKKEDLDALKKSWDMIPSRYQQNPEIVNDYTKQLLQYKDQEMVVEAIIARSLKKDWNKGLVDIYGRLIAVDPKKQLATAEAWLKRYPNQSMLYLALARISIRCELWGKARGYFEKSLELEASASVYGEYGKLQEKLGDLGAAMNNYRLGLNKASS